MANDTSSFFGTAAPAVVFKTIGDAVTGTVVDKELRQQTDLDTDELQFWSDGRPKMQAVLTLQVKPETEDDDGLRRLFVRGYMQRAFSEAVKAAGQKDVNMGDRVYVEYTADGEPPRKGLNGPKFFKAEINGPVK